MDKIYSRKRIRIPKIKGFYLKENRKLKKAVKLILIIVVALFTFGTIFKSINPIFYRLCLEQICTMATEIINEESNNVLNNMDYKEIVSVVYDENNNMNILKTDVVIINRIASDIALKTENRFKEVSNKKVEIPIGSLTGNEYLSGIGPSIKIGIIPTGNVITELKSEFESKGINQTVYRVYLELRCKVSVLTSYKTIDEEIINQVLLVETVVVGKVPDAYYNLQGVNSENAIDIIN